MSDQQFRRDLICAALAGLSSDGGIQPVDEKPYEQTVAELAVRVADAALAAAGEQDGAMTWRDVAADFDAKLSAAQAEIARLKRLAEPLTEEEKRLAAKEAHGHLVVRDLVALDLTNPNFSVRLFVAMIEQSITAVKNRRA